MATSATKQNIYNGYRTNAATEQRYRVTARGLYLSGFYRA